VNAPPVRAAEDGVYVEIRVVPSARENSVSYSDGVLKVKTTAPAEKGKANREAVKILKPLFGACEIASGHKARRKTIRVRNMDSAGFKARLDALTGGGTG